MKSEQTVAEKMSIFEGSTGGWLSAAELEEKYALIWNNTALSSVLELPTGCAIIMSQGLNVFYFARKEQCLALAKQLRATFKINDWQIFRIFPNGEAQFLHPKDGIPPEKVKEGRIAVGTQNFSIGNQ